MARQEASIVVAVPLEAVEARLADVSRWPEFLAGLESVEPAGFERFRFTIAGRGRQRTLPVCVVPHAAEHRISWRALEGPRYIGELRLRAVDDRHTRVDLTMIVDPDGLRDGLREIVGGEPMAELTIQHLDAFVSRTPQGDPAE